MPCVLARTLLETTRKEEEEHVDCLEVQLRIIKKTGVENYLSRQVE